MNIAVESALKNHMKEYDLDGSLQDAFEHFVNYTILRNYTSRHFDPSIMCTDKGEVSIDGLAIIINDTIVTSRDQAEGIFNISNKDVKVDFIFSQAKTEESFAANDISLLFTVAKNFFGDKKNRIKMNSQMDELASVADCIFENAYKLSPNPMCHFYFATNGVWNNVDTLQKVIDDGCSDLIETNLFCEIEFSPLDQNKLLSIYRQIKNSVKCQITIEQSCPVPKIDGVEEAYIGVIKCKDYLNIITDDEDKLNINLFEDNVRYFQGSNTVNMEITNTINDDESQKAFALLNNGITIVAKDIRRTGTTYSLTDFQIVNGCQTSFVLFNSKAKINDNTTMVVKLVSTKDESLISNITKATNRQTPVQQEAFETLRLFHKKLEVAYSGYDGPFKLYYERRSKQYEASDINKTKVVSLSAQMFMVI